MPEPTTEPGRLGTRWERRQLLEARVMTVVFFAVATLAALAVRTPWPVWISPIAVALLAALVFRWRTRRLRRRRRILARSFPTEWEVTLRREVVFYRALSETEQQRFRRELQVFLGEKRITGVDTEIDTTTRVLVAASAIIPIFGFHEWEWETIAEILVYPGRFAQDFDRGPDARKNTLGMVGTGFMSRTMILSKPDLIQGFRNAGDKRNVGLHEFAHLVDKTDGTIDGLPEVGIDRASIGPWIELVRTKMLEIEAGDSDIDRYALTNEAEFFAVATEYFFERPGVMQRKHPRLYEMMARAFQQDLRSRVATLTRERERERPRLGRNSPCPCGSGQKYKKCCLKKRGVSF